MEYPQDIWRYIKKFLIFYNKNEFISYQYNRIVNEKIKLATAITAHDNLLSTDGNWVKSNIKWKLIKIDSYELKNDNKKEEIINNIYNHITLKLLDDIDFLIKRNNNLKGNKILDYYNTIVNEYLSSSKMDFKDSNKNINIDELIRDQRIRINNKFYEYSIYLNK